jgi:hypothetical protein
MTKGRNGRPTKLGPAILRIEGLSDGKDHRMVDDFTGQAIDQPNAKAPLDYDEVVDAKRRQRVKDAKTFLQVYGLMPGKPDLTGHTMAEPAKPKLKHNQTVIHAGDQQFVITPKPRARPPWRKV